jgi:phage recombination protein Bet
MTDIERHRPTAMVAHEATFSDVQLRLIADTICKGASEAELHLFVNTCRRLGLDPFARQAFFVKRGGSVSIQVSIDGFRLVAQRSGEYAGQIGPQWCGPDGAWMDVWLSSEPPAAARVGVMRRGFHEPLFAVARWDSYAQPSNPIWKQMPDLMLAKCCEALALRRAFPAELSGVYTVEEMHQADDEGAARQTADDLTADEKAWAVELEPMLEALDTADALESWAYHHIDEIEELRSGTVKAWLWRRIRKAGERCGVTVTPAWWRALPRASQDGDTEAIHAAEAAEYEADAMT